MQARPIHVLRTTIVATAVLATLGLAACNKPSEPTVGQRVDGAIADARTAADKAQQATADAAAAAKDGMSDMAITAEIKTAQVADDQLSAMKIDVDTRGGRVTLTGTAPDASSRDRATVLAAGVEGVRAVDNRLSLKAR